MGWNLVGKLCVLPLVWALILTPFSLAQTGPQKLQEMRAHFAKAEAALRANRPDEASAEFRAVLALDPGSIEARANLGVIAFVQGKYAEAGEHFRQALKVQPSLWKAQAMLGLCEKRLGRFESAQALLEKSFPHIQEAKLRSQVGLDLAELDYQGGDVLKTVQVLQALERTDPGNPDVLYAAYRVYSTLAGHALDGIALIEPDSARMHQIMAEHLVNRGDLPGAIAQYRKALALNPRLSGAHFELGEALLQSSRSDAARSEAKKEFEAALALNPYDAKSECWLGQIYVSMQQPATALKHYSQALEFDPKDVDIQLGLGKVLSALNRPKEALPHLQEALRLDPLNAVAHYRLASVYRQLGRFEEARREAASFREVTDQKKKIIAVYQQMHEAPSRTEIPDPEVPQ